MMIMTNNKRFYTPEEAERTAKIMNETDEDWNYVVKHDPKRTGYSFIEVYDEENEFVCYWWM
jgi:hypothetical protein